MKRIVEPELLDKLAPTDPRAIHSRRDLRKINYFMGNVGIIEGLLRSSFPDRPPKRIVELGAGDGTFMLELARRFSPGWKTIDVILVDQQSLIQPETIQRLNQLGWNVTVARADVFHWLATSDHADCILANLFLHHFDSESLKELLQLVSFKTNVFTACEPRRNALAIAGTKLLRLIGCNGVTLHDAAVSVRAGFRGNEISELWQQDEKWRIVEEGSGVFSHQFVAKS